MDANVCPTLKDETFQKFLHDDFDVKAYASQALQGVAIAEQLSKLAAGINALDKEIQDQVSAHYDDLLSQATSIEALEGVLNIMHNHIQTLLTSVEKLRSRIVEPYNKLSNQTVMLSNLQTACDLLRVIIRIINLGKRLQSQLQGGVREITKAARSVSEIDYLCANTDLTGIEVIEKDQKMFKQARRDVEKQAQSTLEKGIESQNLSQMSTGLQVMYTLGCLGQVVDKVIHNERDVLQRHTQAALSVQQLTNSSSDAVARARGPGKAAMPVPGNTARFRATLWTNMERLMDQIHASCSRIQHLHKVLAKVRDPVTHVCFLDELAKEDKAQISKTYWDIVTSILYEEFNKASNESTFIKQAFEGEYPKLLRLHSDLWKRLHQFNMAAKSQNASGDITSGDVDDFAALALTNKQRIEEEDSPEMALRRTLAVFEQAYLSRSLSRLFDPVNLMFSTSTESTPVVSSELDNVVKAIVSELNFASVDAALSNTIAKNVCKTIKLFCVKCEETLTTDQEAKQMIGPPTSAQILNASVVNLLYSFDLNIKKMLSEQGGMLSATLPEEAGANIRSSLQTVQKLMVTGIQPLLTSIEEYIEKILITMYEENFSEGQETSSPNAPCSLYMKELQHFIGRVHSEHLQQYKCGDVLTQRQFALASRAIQLFVRFASLVRPLGDGGKMKLAADFAQMELAVQPLCPKLTSLGKSYKMLRSFKPFLFQTPEHIANSPALGDVIPYSSALHFLFARAPPEMPSPQKTAGWTVSDYSRWMDEHSSEKDRLKVIQGALEAYVRVVRQKQGKEFASVYPEMVALLQRANQAAS